MNKPLIGTIAFGPVSGDPVIAGRQVEFTSESATPERIVRALAGKTAPISSSMDGPCCHLCDTYPPHRLLSDHSPRCAWRMAREWAERNPSASGASKT